MKSRALFFFLVSLLVPNFAGAFLISDQGTNVREIATGDLLEFGNLTIKIYDSQSEGNLIFSQTVENAIVNGSWNLMINPDLEYGRVYWKDYEINGESVSFDGNNRLQFQSSVGSITNSSFIDFSLIDSCPEGSSIRLINSNGSVECVLIITGEIDLSNYALKNQSEIFEGNLTTTGTGFFGFLGSLASRVTKLWVGEINATGNIETSGNVSANYFIGDGSLLTGLSESGAYNDSWINQTFFNKTQILAFGYYNASNFVITDYFTKTDVLNLGYFNSTNLQNLSQLNDNLGNRGYTHLSNFTNDLGVGNYMIRG